MPAVAESAEPAVREAEGHVLEVTKPQLGLLWAYYGILMVYLLMVYGIATVYLWYIIISIVNGTMFFGIWDVS